ncbi:MAG: hypothetical protein KKB62_00960 [Nanoarchaeota archaeon]|nr:hypothetical protein [Nanoarchaeota archaeon]
MKKVYLFIILGILLIQPIMAIDLDVKKLSSNEVMIKGLNDSATFRIEVTNNGPSDSFTFYTFFGKGFESIAPVQINSGDSKVVELKISPRLDYSLSGHVRFNYFIQASDRTELTESFTVNLIELKDAFEVGASSIDPESSSIKIYIHNKVNFDFEDLNVEFSSPFFDLEETVDVAPYEKKEFEINLNKENFSKLMAGFYTLNAGLSISSVTGEVEGTISFIEKNILKEEKDNYGFIIYTTIIKKINEGNTPSQANIAVDKNIISRIFTSFSVEPDDVRREGFGVTYIWNREVSPGESFEVRVNTNWLIPLIIVILIVLTVVFARKYSNTDLVLRKRVSFVNAKGGEFALKVLINIESRRFIENVKIFDRLPPLVKIYEKFGGTLPKRFNKTRRVFEWELGSLEAGERRTLSYVIYSKVGVLGKFALPSTTSTFEREGKEKSTSSNKTFFLADQKSD